MKHIGLLGIGIALLTTAISHAEAKAEAETKAEMKAETKSDPYVLQRQWSALTHPKTRITRYPQGIRVRYGAADALAFAKVLLNQNRALRETLGLSGQEVRPDSKLTQWSVTAMSQTRRGDCNETRWQSHYLVVVRMQESAPSDVIHAFGLWFNIDSSDEHMDDDQRDWSEKITFLGLLPFASKEPTQWPDAPIAPPLILPGAHVH